MATRLKNIVRFTGLVVGVATPLPHNLNLAGVAVQPDQGMPQQGNFTVTASTTDVTVTRNPGDPDNVDVFVEYFHSEERVFGQAGNAFTQLNPAPFIIQPGVGNPTLANAASGVARFDAGFPALISDDFNDLFYDDTVGASRFIPMPAPGSVVGLAIAFDTNITQGTLDLNVLIAPNGTTFPQVALGPGVLTIQLVTGIRVIGATFAPGTFLFAAGDVLGLEEVTSGNFLPGLGAGDVTGSILVRYN